MNTKLTLYDRATPEQRKEIRKKALKIPCPDCKAPIGQSCRGIGGHPAQPHWARRK